MRAVRSAPRHDLSYVKHGGEMEGFPEVLVLAR